MDISDTLAPDSDQLDAVELAEPRTFVISKVSKGSTEQPVEIWFEDFPRPWRPGKSMRRVLVACWSADASKYVGRKVRLFCDPKVVFGGQAVGGTRIESLSHIDKPKNVPLLVSRGKSAMFTVQPLKDEPAAAAPKKQQNPALARLAAAFDQAAIPRPQRLALVAEVVGRTVTTPNDLTDDEIAAVTAELQLRAQGPADIHARHDADGADGQQT